MDKKILNEFRQEPVSGEWVLFASGRANRPSAMRLDNVAVLHSASQPQCPFDDPVASGQEIIKLHPSEKDWRVAVIENKYPALVHGVCSPLQQEGLFGVTSATGFHEVVVTRDHMKDFQDLSSEETALTLSVLRSRYEEIAKEFCGQYISVFHNFGAEAGASILHPHSQIMAIPIVPPDILRSVLGAEKFYKENKRKVHGAIVEWEMKQKNRIVEENGNFVAFCPFVSKKAYEVRIFPKNLNPRFERTRETELTELATMLNSILRKITKILHNPAYNFFIHSAPIKVLNFVDMEVDQYYSWHMEIFPHFGEFAGFEFGTGIIINTVDPDQAAKELRNA